MMKNFFTPVYSRVEELKQNFEAKSPKDKKPKTIELKGKKIEQKSKIKEMIFLFDSKISNIIHSNKREAVKFETLVNEYSPEREPSLKSPTIALIKPMPTTCNSFSHTENETRQHASQPTVKKYEKFLILENKKSQLQHPLSEEDFSQLSVKNKTRLYTKFIEEMVKGNTNLGNCANKNTNLYQENEVQAKVRHLVQEYEKRCRLTQTDLSPSYQTQSKNEIRVTPEAYSIKSTNVDGVIESRTPANNLKITININKCSKGKQYQVDSNSGSAGLGKVDVDNFKDDIDSPKKRNDNVCDISSNECNVPSEKVPYTAQGNLSLLLNQEWKELFQNWLKEYNGNFSNSNLSENLGESSSSCTNLSESSLLFDKFLEEAVEKLKNECSKGEKILHADERRNDANNTTTQALMLIDPPQKTAHKNFTFTIKAKREEIESGLSSVSKPPENELQKSHDHNPAALSEHQLRIQASLQRLNIPDWFRQYNQNQSRSPEGAVNTSSYRPGNFTRKRTQDSGRWAGLNSKTTSLSSLGSQRSDRSPLLLSPSAHSHHGGQTSLHTHHIQNANVSAASGGAGTFSRWSTSHLNSSQISPSVSQRGSFSRGGPINSSFMSVSSGHSAIRNSMRQPYMGWRSQEKLSQRTAHERLASSLLAQQQRTSPNTRTTILTSVSNGSGNNKLPPLVTPEIQTSIKEVTSAIVHYVNDQTNQQRSRSTSPNSRKCWLESSFVGTRPLDSPQTPIIENTTFTTAVAAAAAASLLSTTNIASAATTTNNNNNNFHTANHNQYNLNTRQNLPINLFGDEAVLTRMNNGGALNNGTTTYSSVASASGTNLIPNISTGYTGLAAAPERSLSSASLEDVLTSLLGLSTTTTYTTTATVTSGVTLATDATATYARSSTGDAIASEAILAANDLKHMPQNIHQQTQPSHPEYEQQKENIQQHQLQVLSKEDQQRLRRRSEGDAPTQKSKQLQQNQKLHQYAANANVKTAYASDSLTTLTHSSASSQPAANNVNIIVGTGTGSSVCLAPRRVSLGDSSESNNKTISAASGELQIKCRNTKCDRNATPADAKKYYKSCHNCTYLYCSRECRRAHWEKHRKACLHSRASNLCRQVLATCKDDLDSQRHLSLMARKGYLSQGRGVVRILFRSAEAAEGFIKHGFQCLGEASYVRWPDLMPAEMGLELYSELLRFSTEYKPESKMLIYVAICVVSEAPGMGQAPVRWERQLVSRCAKLKLCKSVLAELEQPSQPTSGILQQQQQQLSQPITMITVPEPTTEVLILTFNPQLRTSTTQRELVFSNILNILSRRGVVLRRHYPEIFQRLQSFAEGQTDKFNPVTLHPRNSQTGQNFVCIIMPVHSESEIIKLPSAADGGNRVTTIDVGSQAALAQLDDDELLMRTSS